MWKSGDITILGEERGFSYKYISEEDEEKIDVQITIFWPNE